VAPPGTAGRSLRARRSSALDRPAEEELLGGAGHADVEETALLRQVMIALRRRVVKQARRQGKGIAAVARRESVLHQAHHEDDREFETLGPVVGQDMDRVARVDVGLRCRWVVSSTNQRVELLDEEWQPVVTQQR